MKQENRDIERLPMSIPDIVQMYKEAKDKRQQIKILADLNVCSQETVILALKAGGLDGRQLPRDTKRYRSAVEAAESLVEPSVDYRHDLGLTEKSYKRLEQKGIKVSRPQEKERLAPELLRLIEQFGLYTPAVHIEVQSGGTVNVTINIGGEKEFIKEEVQK